MSAFSGRWNHVYKLWKNALSKESFPQFDRFLSNEFAKNSAYGSKDRRWYSDVLFSAVRYGYFALFCTKLFPHDFSSDYISEFKNKIQSPSDILNEFRNVDFESFFTWISLRCHLIDKKLDAHAQFNKMQDFYKKLEQILNSEKGILEYKLLFHSVPLWFSDFFTKRIEISNLKNKEHMRFLENLDTRPPLWLRLNNKEKKEEVLQELKKEDFYTEDFHELEDDALKIIGLKSVFNLNSYKNGLFEIQDLASQHIGSQVKVQPKQYVWDCCAGGGGKTIQIASFLKNKGVIYASDIRQYKLEEVKKRAKRAGFFNVRTLPWNGENLPSFQKEIQIKGGFNWVLVDAPCSSTGTWRRNPDAKYRVNHEGITDLATLQLSILTAASKAVINEGHLVYSTCSWIEEENEGIVREFLKSNPKFSLVTQNLLGSPFENADTMFVAVMCQKN